MCAFGVTEELAGWHSDSLTSRGPLLSTHNLFIPRAITDAAELCRQLARGAAAVPAPVERPRGPCSACVWPASLHGLRRARGSSFSVSLLPTRPEGAAAAC